MNEGLQIHPMHLHGIPQLVIARDGYLLPTPHLRGHGAGGSRQRVDVLIDASEVGVWAFHRHVLTHAEAPPTGCSAWSPRSSSGRGEDDRLRPLRWDEEQVSHIIVRRRALSEPARLAWAVRAARRLAGREVEPPPAGMHRYQADLRLRVSDHPSLVTFRKAAYVDIGPVKSLGDGGEVELSWRASTLAPLFPVFSGTIVAPAGELTISGAVRPAGRHGRTSG